jgi:polyisoprenoid-binding protein YceI
MTTQAATLGKAITWQVDPAHTHVEFAVRHLMIATVRGRFSDVTGTVIVPDGTSHALSSRRRLASRASIHVSRSGTRI